MKHIAQALLQAQKNIKNALKDAKNPHFKNDYATLESVIDAVKDQANAAGVLIVQGTGADEFGQYVNTTLIHADSGESMSSKTYLTLDKSNMQGLGSAITYARRYGLAAMFSITQADDDGNMASQPSSWSFKQFNDQLTNEDPVGSDKYTVPFGKFNKRTLEQIPMKELEDYIIYLENKAKKEGKQITGVVKDFIERATDFLNSFEQWAENNK
jgi:hypothetical protein